tara:strand:+ start:2668 stop:3150 length:483 start_codon:yes stop_codon:yes gene_type:complete
MVKYLTLFLFVFFIGCEMNSEQLIKSENINFENVKFNAVSKNLDFTNIQEGPEVETTKKLVKDWFNNNVKTDGFDGNLNINVTSIEINKIKKEEYYRFEINISIEFLETNELLNKRKIYKINSIEYGDIEGSFSIKDTENLNENIISNSLKSINQQVSVM